MSTVNIVVSSIDYFPNSTGSSFNIIHLLVDNQTFSATANVAEQPGQMALIVFDISNLLLLGGYGTSLPVFTNDNTGDPFTLQNGQHYTVTDQAAVTINGPLVPLGFGILNFDIPTKPPLLVNSLVTPQTGSQTGDPGDINNYFSFKEPDGEVISFTIDNTIFFPNLITVSIPLEGSEEPPPFPPRKNCCPCGKR